MLTTSKAGMTYGATEGGTQAGWNEGVPREEAKPGLSTAVSWFPERTVPFVFVSMALTLKTRRARPQR